VPVNVFYYIIYDDLLCFNYQLLRPLKNPLVYVEFELLCYVAVALFSSYPNPAKFLQKPITFCMWAGFQDRKLGPEEIKPFA